MLFAFTKPTQSSVSLGGGPVIEWEKSIGGSSAEIGQCILEMPNGSGFLVAGYSKSNDNGMATNGLFDFVAIQIDSDGNQIWSDHYGGTDDDVPTSMQLTSDGGFILAGFTQSNDVDVDNNYGFDDGWIVRVGPDHIVQWDKNYGGESDDRIETLKLDNNKYLVASRVTSTLFDIQYNTLQTACWMARVDQNGQTFDWKTVFDGNNFDEAYDITRANGGNYMVAGTTNSTDLANGSNIPQGAQDYDFLMVRLNPQGNPLWSVNYGGTGRDVAQNIIRMSDNSGYLLAGTISAGGGNVSSHYGSRDFWVIKLDNNGALLWEKNYGGSGLDSLYSMSQASDGNFYLAGTTDSNDHDVSSNNGGRDAWIVKINPNGNILWEKNFGGPGAETASAVIETSDGGLIFTGQSGAQGGDVSVNHGLNDIWVAKLQMSCIAQDSLALMSLYNATNGPSWTPCNWSNNFGQPLNNWCDYMQLTPDQCNVETLIVDDVNMQGQMIDLQLPELKLLNLALNKLDGNLPDFTNMPKLEEMFFSVNLLDSNIPDFSNLPNLRKLHIRNNNLSDTLPNFSMLPTLNQLSIHDNEFDGLPKFTHFINSNQEFELLHVQNNRLSFDDIIPLLELQLSSQSALIYSPQKPFFDTTNIAAAVGDDVTINLGIDPLLTTNEYVWWLNGNLAFTVNTNTYTFNNIQPSQFGTYIVRVSNDSVTGLILESYPITISNSACDPATNLNALQTIYNNTNNGMGWDLATNWNQVALPLGDEYGIDANPDGCVNIIDMDGMDDGMVAMNVDGNNLTGTLPNKLYDLTSLEKLILRANPIQGSLDSNIENLSLLKTLSLSYTELGGTLPDEIGSLTELEFFEMDNTNLQGPLPDVFGGLDKLEYLELDNNDDLNGPLPNSLGGLQSLKGLYAYNCSLEGAIPDGLKNLPMLNTVVLFNNNLTGAVPMFTQNLFELTIQDNDLDFLPDLSTITSWGSQPFQGLHVENNKLTFDDILPNMPIKTVQNKPFVYAPQQPFFAETTYTVNQGDNLTIDLGIDPSITTSNYAWCIGNIALYTENENFRTFDNIQPQDAGTYTVKVTNDNVPGLTLESYPIHIVVNSSGGCNFPSTTPEYMALQAIYNMANVTAWSPCNWNFTGSIDDSWCGIAIHQQSCEIWEINLFGNPIQCDQWFGGNGLEGQLADVFDMLPNLRGLQLQSNKLSGPLPNSISQLTELQVLRLGHNAFDGEIPPSWQSLKKLRNFELDSNMLEGGIPPSFGSLDSLRYFAVGSNKLDQELPPTLGNLPFLMTLHVDNNQIPGAVPASFGNLDKLFLLDLDHNQLTSVETNFCNSPLERLRLNDNLLEDIPDFACLNATLKETYDAHGCSWPSGLYVQNNRLTFEDLLPNKIIFDNHPNSEYSPQAMIYQPETFDLCAGDTFTIDLGIDELVLSNEYYWYKDGNELPGMPIVGNNSFSINGIVPTDAGVYSCQVKNPGLPELTLYSYDFTLIFSCCVLDLTNLNAIANTACAGSNSMINISGLPTQGLQEPLTIEYTINGNPAPSALNVDVTPGGEAVFSIGSQSNGTTFEIVQITSADNCGHVVSLSGTVQSGSPIATVVSTQPSQCAGNTGSIEVFVQGGTPVYSYLWSNGSTSQNPTGLPAGDYQLTVTDDNDCTDVLSATVAQSDPPVASLVAAQPSDCSSNTGSIEVSVQGGTPVYSYLWSNGSTSQNLTGLPAGAYQLTVTDANDCTDVLSATVAQSDPPVASLVAAQPSDCSGNTGSIEVSVQGGTPVYSYLWSNGSPSQNPTGLPAGAYQLTVTDANDCTDTLYATVAQSDPPVAFLVAAQPSDCSGNTGSIEVSVQGGTPVYTYLWSNGSTSQNLTGLPAGDYQLTVTDANSCTATITATVPLDANNAAQAEILTPDEILCEDGFTLAAVLPPGTTGFWTADPSTIVIDEATNPNTFATNLQPGENQFTWTLSTQDCPDYSFDMVAAELNSQPNAKDDILTLPVGQLSLDLDLLFNDSPAFGVIFTSLGQPADGTTTFEKIDGKETGNFFWTGPTTAKELVFQYRICLDNCPDLCDIATVTIQIEAPAVTDPPTGISPNGDGINDEFIIPELEENPGKYPKNELVVFNRWGDIVFQAKPYNNDWTGTNQKNGKDLPAGTYFYIIRLDIGEGEIKMKEVVIVR